MPKTLLLADDSVTIQKVVGISFANEDVRIVTVDNGDDAVARAKEIRPDIVLADVVMPGKSGYDVCAALKGDPALSHIPVLLLTGTFETFDEDRAARVGADGHITKPFEAQALVELVNARLSARAPSRAVPATAAPAAEPEPFDFLEPEAGTASRPSAGTGSRSSAGTARPIAAEPEDAFAFDAEPLEAIDLDTEDEAEIDLGNEATAARTTLLLDDDPAFARAATAPPVRGTTAPPARPAASPPAAAPVAPTRGGTTPPVRPAAAPPPSAAKRADPVPTPLPTAADFDDAEELTRLVLPAAPKTAAAAPAEGVDPLSDLQPFAAEPFAGAPAERRSWDVASDELAEPFAGDEMADTAPPPGAADAADDLTPPAFASPLFDDDAAAEFELTDIAPTRPPASKGATTAVNPVPTPPAPSAAAAAAAAPAELSGAMRDQVHTTIEKIAWEALGDVSERIVKEAVARIEQVAWDVIPRLAETLIREEIRKLKGES